MTRLPLVAALLLALLLALGGAPPAAAQELSRNPHLGMVGHRTGTPAAMLDTAGVSYVRHDIRWYDVDPEGDGRNFRWGAGRWIDDILAVTENVEIVAVIGYSPGPARIPACVRRLAPLGEPLYHCAPTPAYYDAWEAFVRAAADRYPEVDHWEIWNETAREDGAGLFFQTAGGRADGSVYDSLVVRAKRALNPEDRLIASGAFADRGPLGRGWRTEWTMGRLRSVGSHIDVVSFHLYADVPAVVDAARALRRAMAAEGFRQPIWVTEMGFGLAGGRRARDGEITRYLRDFLRRVDGDPIDVGFYWSWDRDRNVLQDGTQADPRPDGVLDDIVVPAYCLLVRDAGNLEREGTYCRSR